MAVSWSPWFCLKELPPLTARVLAEIVDGGQAFRWRAEPEGIWRGQWSEHLVRVRLGAGGLLEWQAPVDAVETTAPAIRHYFAVDVPYDAGTDTLPWRSDAGLREAMAAFPNLRLLQQPFGETLLGFLCSATKQIVQIRQMMDLLATRLGRPVQPGFDRLPSWSELAQVSEAQLRACALGFRARYIHQTAHFLAENVGWLEATAAADYTIAKARLCTLPGVGEKVADCVLLFGAGKREAFPVDTWILRVLADTYDCRDWTPAQVAHFGRIHFGSWAGLAQQFLFAHARDRSTPGAAAKRRGEKEVKAESESAPPRSPRGRQ